MGLGLINEESSESGGGLFKYMANEGNYTYDGAELDDDFAFVIDHTTVETGWIRFVPPVDFSRLSPLGSDNGKNPEPPTAGESSPYSLGFKIRVYSKKIDGVKHLMSNSYMAKLGYEPLFDKIFAEAKSNAGKMPVVSFDLDRNKDTKRPGRQAHKKGPSTNWEPLMKIVKWVDPPADLAVEETPKAAGVGSPSAAGSEEPEF